MIDALSVAKRDFMLMIVIGIACEEAGHALDPICDPVGSRDEVKIGISPVIKIFVSTSIKICFAQNF